MIKGDATVQLRISAVLLRKPGRWDVPYAEEDTIDLIQQYNTLYSTSTKLYTKVFGTSGRPDMDRADSMTVNAYNEMNKIIERAAREDPLINTDGLYESVQENVYSKIKDYKNSYLHWYVFLIAMVVAVIAYLVPMILLKFHERQLQERMDDEVIQFQSIILLLVYFDSVNVITILEWLDMFADVFSRSLQRCIATFTLDEQAALQGLYDSEPFEPFQDIVENLMMVDDVGVFQAFNELETTRASNQEKRNQENQISVSNRASITKIVSMVPMMVIIGGYLILPFMIEAVEQLLDLVSAMSTM